MDVKNGPVLEKKDFLLCQKTLTIVVVTIDYDETKTKENLEIAVLRICCHRFLCWGFVFIGFHRLPFQRRLSSDTCVE